MDCVVCPGTDSHGASRGTGWPSAACQGMDFCCVSRRRCRRTVRRRRSVGGCVWRPTCVVVCRGDLGSRSTVGRRCSSGRCHPHGCCKPCTLPPHDCSDMSRDARMTMLLRSLQQMEADMLRTVSTVVSLSFRSFSPASVRCFLDLLLLVLLLLLLLG